VLGFGEEVVVVNYPKIGETTRDAWWRSGGKQFVGNELAENTTVLFLDIKSSNGTAN